MRTPHRKNPRTCLAAEIELKLNGGEPLVRGHIEREYAAGRNSFDNTAPAYLVIFDRRPKAKEKPWEERLTWSFENGITVVGA